MGAQTAFALTPDEARRNGLAWLVSHQQGDGANKSLRGLEVQATAAFVEALTAGGLGKSPQQAQALAWLANSSASSLDARAAQIEALAAAGRNVSLQAAAVRDARNKIGAKDGALAGGVATWGPYAGYAGSTLDTALGYAALRSAGLRYDGDANEGAVTVLCLLLPAQLSASPWAGAWPYGLPQSGQPANLASGSLLATAHTTLELKRMRQAGTISAGVSACSRTFGSGVDTALGNAKTWLLAQRNADKGFAERNPQSGNLENSHPLLTALAIRALAPFAAEGDSAATSAIADARAWLANQQVADGSWLGDGFVTARVLSALPAASGAALVDTDSDGLSDVVEQRLGTSITVADSQGELPTNATAIGGITAPAFVVTGIVHQSFAHTLSAEGGQSPYVFSLKRGTLPAGLTLASNGAISGKPTQIGSFAFDYQVSDAQAQKAVVIGRIDIQAAPVNDTGDVPIPLWALAGLALVLLGLVRRPLR